MNVALASFATSRPKTVYAIVVFLTVVLGSMITGIQIDTDPESMLAETQSDRVYHNEIEKRFSISDAIVVGVVNEDHPDGIYNVRSLAALHALSEEILKLDGVVALDLMSVAQADNLTQEGPGTIRFEWLMKDAPQTQEQALEIRDKIEQLPLLMNSLVAGDGKAATIYVPIENKDQSYRLSQEISQLMSELDSDDDYHITGLPVAEDTFGHDMFVQMGISAPLAGLMIFLLMLYFFRSAALVIAPMLVAMATVIISVGLLISAGFTVHIMSSMIPIFLMPIAVVDSVHIMSEFADTYRPGMDPKKVIRDVVGHLFTPMLYTSLTSAVGFLSLLLTPIPPVQVFGAFVAFGILLAFLLTILLIPAYVVRMSPKAIAKMASHTATPHTETLLARMLRRTGVFAVRRAKLVVVAAVVLLAVSVAGISRIEINDNPVRWFKSNHPIRVADEVLNRHFAGTYDAFVVFEADNTRALPEFVSQAEALLTGIDARTSAPVRQALEADKSAVSAWLGDIVAAVDDAMFETSDAQQLDALDELMRLAEEAQTQSKVFQSPEMLQMIADIQVALDSLDLVGKTNALPDVAKVVNRELRSGEDRDYVIPGSAAGVAQALMQFQSSHRPHDLWHIVTPDFSSTAIWVQLKSGDNQDMSGVMRALDDYLEANPLPDNIKARWAGKTFINVIWQDGMVNGMLVSLLGAFVVVFLMMALLFRSARTGLLAMVPLSVTILGVYGIIGWIGKDYDMPIAVLSSLTLGLSVDFAIHFIERTRALQRSSGSFDAAIEKAFEEPARAIARNAIVIAIGFTPLFFAPLVPYITVGAFMAAIMALSGVTTLILLPAIMSLTWRRPT